LDGVDFLGDLTVFSFFGEDFSFFGDFFGDFSFVGVFLGEALLLTLVGDGGSTFGLSLEARASFSRVDLVGERAFGVRGIQLKNCRF